MENYSVPERSPARPMLPEASPLRLQAETSSCFNGYLSNATASLRGFLLQTTALTLYTVPAKTKAEIKEIHVCNKTATDRTFTIRVVPYGGTTSDDYAIYCDYAIKAKESITFHHKTHMPAGYFIDALASANDAIRIYISGVEVVMM